MKVQEPFILVPMQGNCTGILKVEGEREFKVNIWTLPGADATDNEWVLESIKNLYLQYYHRVKQYKENV